MNGPFSVLYCLILIIILMDASLSCLRIIVINFQSLYGKRASFWQFLEEVQPDVVLGSETWLNKSITDGEVLPPTYKFAARRDRPENPHGGVVIVIKSTLQSSKIRTGSNTELVAASIETRTKPVIVCSLYRPPDNNTEYSDRMCAALTDIHSKHKRKVIWIGGDANLPDICWENERVTGHNYVQAINTGYIETLRDVGCQQMVTFPTRLNNTLDIFATNRPSLVTKCSRLPGLGDHDAVLVETSITPKPRRPVRRLIYLWSRADLPALATELGEYVARLETTAQSEEPPTVQTLWQDFKDVSTAAITRHVPSKLTSARFSQSWANRDVKRSCRRKKRAHEKARRTNDPDDWQRYYQLQKEARQTCRNAYNDYIKDMISEDTTNKKLYSFIKSKRTDASGIPRLLDNNILKSKPREKAEILNRQFSSVFTQENLSSIPDLGVSPHPAASDITVAVDGVRALLDRLSPHKASGPDQISSRFLKTMSAVLAPALTIIFQASLDQVQIPDDWKRAYVTPIFKKGDKARACNYRPVSLTSVSCKVLEHIIHSQIINHLDTHGVLADQQHGFRKNRSCESQLIATVHDLAKGLDQRQQIDAIALDFSKAFDKVPHQRLAAKLKYHGVRGKTLRWIECFLSGRTQQVVVEGDQSAPAPVTSGVPQGTVLGPLLFLVYINDLPQRVTATSRLFADDCLIYRNINNTADSDALQKDLDSLQDWEQRWQMSFNPDKCETIRITNKTSTTTKGYSIHGKELKTTNNIKYLGLNIDNKLSWEKHVKSTTAKASNTLAFLRRNISCCPRSIRLTAYKTLIRPQLEYAATVWDNSVKARSSAVEAIQRRAARFIMGDYDRRSSVTNMLNELNLESLKNRRKQAKLATLYRATHNMI